MTVLITLTQAGVDSGPFSLYSNIDGYDIPFETNISAVDLLAGYSSSLVPDFASIIKIKSNGNCVNFIDIGVETTTTTSTTTTTTTSIPLCITYTLQTISKYIQTASYRDCSGTLQTIEFIGTGILQTVTFCALETSVNADSETIITSNGNCSTNIPPIVTSIDYITNCCTP